MKRPIRQEEEGSKKTLTERSRAGKGLLQKQVVQKRNTKVVHFGGNLGARKNWKNLRNT